MNLGLLSNAALNPKVFWSTVFPPLYSSIVSRGGARVIDPPALSWGKRREWMQTRAEVKACDALFWVQLSHRQQASIHAASYLRPTARRSTYILDAWKPLLNKIGLVATLDRYDPCFVAYREATDELNRRFPWRKFVWLPFGCDTSVFYPRRQGKPIFAFWMGRREEPLHQALLAYCSARGLRYEFNNGRDYTTEELGEICASSQYFVVTPPPASRSGGYSPLVTRYLEGLAAGTRLLGTLPESGDYEKLLPVDCICVVRPDGSDLEEKLEADARIANREQIVETVGAFVREHHSWRRRGEQIYDQLALGASIQLRTMGNDCRVRDYPSVYPDPNLAVSELLT